MPKPILQKVTITGADNSTDPEELFELSKEFSYVEWGILLSRKKEGTPRYPDYVWLLKLHRVWHNLNKDQSYINQIQYAIKNNISARLPLALSGHICGDWVRNVCEGKWDILDDCKDIEPMFSRFQLNFRTMSDKLNDDFFKSFDNKRLWFRQFIFQLGGMNHKLLDRAQDFDIDAVPVFDLSGGQGKLPEQWPKSDSYSGYAGGLSPDNLGEQLKIIGKVVGKNPIWIDVETNVRSDNDKVFDLNKVREFLEVARPWVIPSNSFALERV